MKLIENWAESWKWISMQASAARGAAEVSLVTCLAVLKPEQRDQVVSFISAHVFWIFCGMFAVTFLQAFGRLVQQSPPNGPQP